MNPDNILSVKKTHYPYIGCSLFYHFASCYLFSLMYDKPVIVKFGFGYCILNLQYTLLSEIIDWTASSWFKDIPYLNSSKRPQPKRPGRVEGYLTYFKRWSVPLFMFTTLWFNEIVKNDVPIQNITTWLNETTIKEPVKNAIVYALYYVRLAAMIQVSLIFADVMYGAWHHMQHKYKWLYYKTNHQYHHQFRYPLARESTWLGFIDLWVSSIMIGRWNISLMAILLGVDLTPFELFMCISYVHEMNCSDHCGKVMPYHNSVPLLPFLEKPLGLGHAVEAHEAHHNLNTKSYGLLGVYDWIMGTTQYASV
jgi:hypothetical protein